MEGLISRERLIKVGAEAELWYGVWLGLPAVFKIRRRKAYRPPELDRRIREFRTSNEVRLMYQARIAGVSVPAIYYVSLADAMIVMEHIAGPTLKQVVDAGVSKDVCRVFARFGEAVGRLHVNSIVHGDLTTSNVIISDDELYLIDFGLGENSSRIEDMGVDLHLLLRALESAHQPYPERLFGCISEGYLAVTGDFGRKVLDKVREIRMRGRYVAMRRRRSPLVK